MFEVKILRRGGDMTLELLHFSADSYLVQFMADGVRLSPYNLIRDV